MSRAVIETLNRSLHEAVPRTVESPRPDLTDRYLGLLLFLAVLAVYLRTLAPSICFGDTGLLVTAVHVLGIPHPPGFPLFLLTGKAFSLVFPFGDPAFKLNAFAALFGALSSAAVYFLVRALGQYKLVALFSAVYAAFLPAQWEASTAAGPRTMSVALVMAALALALFGAWFGDRQALLLAWLSAGLGTTAHPAGLLALPALALVTAGTAAGPLRRASFRMRCLGCLAAPLVIYAAIPIRAAAGPELCWTLPDTPSRFLEYLLHTAGDGAFSVTPLGTVVTLKETALLFVREFSPAGTLAVLLGAWALWHRRRLVLAALLSMIALNVTVVLLLPEAVPVHPLHARLLPALLAAVPLLALGVQYLLGLAALHLVGQKGVPVGLFTAGAGLLLLGTAVLRIGFLYPELDRSGFFAATDHGRNILMTVPDHGHLIASHPLDLYPVLYLSRVAGERRDVRIHDRNGKLGDPGYEAAAPVPPAELEAQRDRIDRRIIREAKSPVLFSSRESPTVRLELAGILLAAKGTGWEGDSEELFDGYRFRNQGRMGRGRIWREAREAAAGYPLNRGDMYRSWGLRRRAEQEYLLAAAIGFDSGWVLRRAASRLIDGGWSERAEECYRRAVDLNPADSEARLALAQIRGARGEEPEEPAPLTEQGTPAKLATPTTSGEPAEPEPMGAGVEPTEPVPSTVRRFPTVRELKAGAEEQTDIGESTPMPLPLDRQAPAVAEPGAEAMVDAGEAGTEPAGAGGAGSEVGGAGRTGSEAVGDDEARGETADAGEADHGNAAEQPQSGSEAQPGLEEKPADWLKEWLEDGTGEDTIEDTEDGTGEGTVEDTREDTEDGTGEGTVEDTREGTGEDGEKDGVKGNGGAATPAHGAKEETEGEAASPADPEDPDLENEDGADG